MGKDGKINMVDAMKQVPTLPKIYLESSKTALEACKNEGKNTPAFLNWSFTFCNLCLGGQADRCEASYDITKCILLVNVEVRLNL